MKFSKSLILAVAVASCSFYVADAATATPTSCADLHRKEKSPPVVPFVDFQSCGDCLDDYYPDAGVCKPRTPNKCTADQMLELNADACQSVARTAFVASTGLGSKNCPANSKPDLFSDVCVCTDGHHKTGTTGLTCAVTKTDAICEAEDANSMMETVDTCKCKPLYGKDPNVAGSKCQPMALDKLSQTDCETVAHRKWDATNSKCLNECKASYATDDSAPHLMCFPETTKVICEANKATTKRSFVEATKLCKCDSGYKAASEQDYSSTVACVEDNGSISSVILSSSVLVVSIIGSLVYLL